MELWALTYNWSRGPPYKQSHDLHPRKLTCPPKNVVFICWLIYINLPVFLDIFPGGYVSFLGLPYKPTITTAFQTGTPVHGATARLRNEPGWERQLPDLKFGVVMVMVLNLEWCSTTKGLLGSRYIYIYMVYLVWVFMCIYIYGSPPPTQGLLPGRVVCITFPSVVLRKHRKCQCFYSHPIGLFWWCSFFNKIT